MSTTSDHIVDNGNDVLKQLDSVAFLARLAACGIEQVNNQSILGGLPPDVSQRLHPELGQAYHGPDIYGNTITGNACILMKEAAKAEPEYLKAAFSAHNQAPVVAENEITNVPKGPMLS